MISWTTTNKMLVKPSLKLRNNTKCNKKSRRALLLSNSLIRVARGILSNTWPKINNWFANRACRLPFCTKIICWPWLTNKSCNRNFYRPVDSTNWQTLWTSLGTRTTCTSSRTSYRRIWTSLLLLDQVIPTGAMTPTRTLIPWEHIRNKHHHWPSSKANHSFKINSKNKIKTNKLNWIEIKWRI